MPTAVAGPEIERLIQLLARLPGLGPRSARRAALHLIKKREQLMAPLGAALATAMEKIEVCRICGNIDTQNPCTVCTDDRRDPSIIVAVADVADLWALERAHAINSRCSLRSRPWAALIFRRAPASSPKLPAGRCSSSSARWPRCRASCCSGGCSSAAISPGLIDDPRTPFAA